MINEIKVKRLRNSITQAVNIPLLFKMENVEYQNISVVNWSETYPYQPNVTFAIAHDSKNIYLHYKVKENCVRSVEDTDLGNVWEDSCCEFFVMPDDKKGYYNIEANCIGSILLCYGKEREKREAANSSILSCIDRWASLGRRALGVIHNMESAWELSLIIPASSFFKHNIKSLDGLVMKANFYKCGDKTDNPHFLSWKKIELPKPDFHCPEFFGTLVFEY